jgi:hypothetical protein
MGKGRGATGHEANPFAAALADVADGKGVVGERPPASPIAGLGVRASTSLDAGQGVDDTFVFELAAPRDHKGAPTRASPTAPATFVPALSGGLSTSAPMTAAFDAWAGQRGLHGPGAQHRAPAASAVGMHIVDVGAATGAHVGAQVEAAVQRAIGTAAAQLKAQGPSLPTPDAHGAHDVEDSLWSERTTISGKAAAAKKRVGTDDDVAAVEAQRSDEQKPADDQKPQSQSSQAQTPSWTLSTMTTPVDRVDAVRDVPPGPLMVATDHLRALLPEGGRVLAASANHVSLELPHLSGPMLLEISLKSGVVDVRARGGAAAEMAWRVPELAAALQSAGVRLGAFEVAPMKKSGDASAADDGPAGDRQNSDDPQPRLRRPEPRGVVAGLTHAFSA